MTSERIASSLARPPALRTTWASPSLRPAYLAGSRRASMHVRMPKRRAGGSARSFFAPNAEAYASFACSTSDSTVIGDPPRVTDPEGPGKILHLFGRVYNH